MPKEWTDAETGRRVVRLTGDAGGSTLYFHDRFGYKDLDHVQWRLAFTRAADGLEVTLPKRSTHLYAYVLAIAGLTMNASTATASGNPQ